MIDSTDSLRISDSQSAPAPPSTNQSQRLSQSGRAVLDTQTQLAYLRDPDVQLMLRTQDGDDSAFTELVNAYQDKLIGTFYHMMHDQGVAEDLAQEVLLRVYRARHNYKPTARFSTWLYRIVNNLASNTRRNKARKREVSLTPRDSGPNPGALLQEKSGLMPNRQFALTEQQKIVRDAMDALNDRQKLAVLLNKFEGMSYADIGDAMDLTPAAVKSLLSRAREKLREKLQGYVS